MKAAPMSGCPDARWDREQRLPLALIGALACLCATTALAQPSRAAPARGIECSAIAPAPSRDYLARIDAMERQLGIAADYGRTHGLTLVQEPATLAVAGKDLRGRTVRLVPAAAVALKQMRAAAAKDGVTLQIVSGYRSAAYQAGLLRSKLNRGMSVTTALSINTPPGYSQHQSGCAVDLATPHSIAADQSFARTPAYAWLKRNGGEYGFHLSYPRGNSNGIEFEPWHWDYVAPVRANAPRAATSSHPANGG